MPQVRPIAVGEWEINDPMPDYSMETIKCQRYYFKFVAGYGFGAVYSDGNVYIFYDIPVNMRILPALTVSNNGVLTINGTTHVADQITQAGIRGSGILLKYVLAEDPLPSWSIATVVNASIEFNADL